MLEATIMHGDKTIFAYILPTYTLRFSVRM